MDMPNKDKHGEHADIILANAIQRYCADIEDAPFYNTFYKNLRVIEVTMQRIIIPNND